MTLPKRTPFDPRKTAAMKAASAAAQGVAPPLALDEERALIEAAAVAGNSPIPAALAGGGTAPRPMTVGQVNAIIKGVLASHLPAVFYIQGEISNYRVYDRGHAFFTLKEPGAELPCVCWKDCLGRMRFKPKDGMDVVARGTIKLYEPQGKVQLYVEEITPKGVGGLELAFRQLCDKLKGEGLFDPSRKRKIPKLPEHVAIVTSRTGDVLHDVLTTAYRRFPGLHTMLYPVRVQGESAAPEIVRAIKTLNAWNAEIEQAETAGDAAQSKIKNQKSKIDLILLVRGGGSLEDLWAFNEEIVARAIVFSRIPIATGIGHEPDTTIADLVGDLRGPTPTGVTELTIPDVRVLRRELDAHAGCLHRDVTNIVRGSGHDVELLAHQLVAAAHRAARDRRAGLDAMAEQVKRIEPRHAIAQGWRRVEEASRDLGDAAGRRLRAAADVVTRVELRLGRAAPAAAVARARDRVDHLAAKLARAAAARFALADTRLGALAKQLRAVGPQSVLDRGYSITLDAEGKVVRSKAQVRKGDRITTKLADGEIKSVVGEPKQGTLF